MADVPDLDTRRFFFCTFSQQGDKAEFKFRLDPEIEVQQEKQRFLVLKACVLPKVRVNFPASTVKLNESIDLTIPELDVADASEIVDAINERLTSDFTPLKFLPANQERPFSCVKVTLLPGQSIRVSPSLADAVTEKKTFLRSNLYAKVLRYAFKIRKDFHANTYYLTCNAVERLQIGDAPLPVLSTLSVNYLGERTHSNFTSDTDHILERAYLRPGIFRDLLFRVCDTEGKTVKLEDGLVFFDIRLCM